MSKALRRYEEGREWQLIFGDALKAMWGMPPASVDLCLADLPYGTTAAAWDSIIPFPEMWAALDRVMKPRAAVLLYGTQPFTTALIASNLSEYQTSWYWLKTKASNFHLAKKQPLRIIEDVCVFRGHSSYFPHGLQRINLRRANGSGKTGEFVNVSEGSNMKPGKEYTQEFTGYPTNVLRYSLAPSERGLHLSRKPVAMNAYLISTYTSRGEMVLDFTCGSGSSGEAAVATGRRWVGVDSDSKHAQTALERVSAVAASVSARKGARAA